MNEMENLCMKMISMSGGAKTKYIQALDAAYQGEFEKATQLLEQGNLALQEGYEHHLQMLQQKAINENENVTLLLAHAEDQLANAELFEMVCRQMIRLYQKIDTLK